MRIAMAVLASVAILALVAVSQAGNTESRLATEKGPGADPVVCDPLPPDQPYCIQQPDPTSTTVETTIPLTSLPPTTVPPAITPNVDAPLHLEGQNESLRVTADLDAAAPIAGQILSLDVRITETGRSAASGVSFGDGARYGLPGPPAVSCSQFTTTSSAGQAREATETYQHAYRLPGEYHIKIKVVSANCTDENEVVLTGTVIVGPGVTLSNGPLAPVVVGARQLETSPGPNAVNLNVHIRDPDGFLTGVTIKWGDGSTETKQYPLGDCIDPKIYWPGPTSDTFVLPHTYGSSGAFEVEVVVSSSGCGGGDAQSTDKRVTVTAAA